MKIGVYVGSFNPVHKGHIHVAEFLLKNNYVDKIYLVPTPNYWDKQDLIDIKLRIKLLKFYESDKIIIDTIHNNFPYTYQVLNSIQKDNINDELILIIGSDNIIKFHLWKNVDEILKNKVLVVRRDETDIEYYTKRFNTNNFIIVKDFNPIEVSSSEIRNNLQNKNLDKKVYDFIKENNLY